MEVVGIVASIAQLATTVFTISKTLYEVGDALSNAPSDIKDLARDLDTFCDELHILSRLLNSKTSRYSEQVYRLTAKIIGDCASICFRIDKILRKLRNGNTMARIKWLYKEKEILKLLARLRDLKLSLMGTLGMLSALKADHMMDAMGIQAPSLIEGHDGDYLSKETMNDIESTRRKLAGISVSQNSDSSIPSLRTESSKDSYDSSTSLLTDESANSSMAACSVSSSSQRSFLIPKSRSPRLSEEPEPSPFISSIAISGGGGLMQNKEAMESVQSFHSAVSFQAPENGRHEDSSAPSLVPEQSSSATDSDDLSMSESKTSDDEAWKNDMIDDVVRRINITRAQAEQWVSMMPRPSQSNSIGGPIDLPPLLLKEQAQKQQNMSKLYCLIPSLGRTSLQIPHLPTSMPLVSKMQQMPPIDDGKRNRFSSYQSHYHRRRRTGANSAAAGAMTGTVPLWKCSDVTCASATVGFKTVEELEDHREEAHSGLSYKFPLSFKCSLCSRAFESRAMCKQHIEFTHTVEGQHAEVEASTDDNRVEAIKLIIAKEPVAIDPRYHTHAAQQKNRVSQYVPPCSNCRDRRVRCSGEKPACKQCTATNRTCEGYVLGRKLYTGDYTGSPSSVNRVVSFGSSYNMSPAPGYNSPVPLGQPVNRYIPDDKIPAIRMAPPSELFQGTTTRHGSLGPLSHLRKRGRPEKEPHSNDLSLVLGAKHNSKRTEAPAHSELNSDLYLPQGALLSPGIPWTPGVPDQPTTPVNPLNSSEVNVPLRTYGYSSHSATDLRTPAAKDSDFDLDWMTFATPPDGLDICGFTSDFDAFLSPNEPPPGSSSFEHTDTLNYEILTGAPVENNLPVFETQAKMPVSKDHIQPLAPSIGSPGNPPLFEEKDPAEYNFSLLEVIRARSEAAAVSQSLPSDPHVYHSVSPAYSPASSNNERADYLLERLRGRESTDITVTEPAGIPSTEQLTQIWWQAFVKVDSNAEGRTRNIKLAWETSLSSVQEAGDFDTVADQEVFSAAQEAFATQLSSHTERTSNDMSISKEQQSIKRILEISDVMKKTLEYKIGAIVWTCVFEVLSLLLDRNDETHRELVISQIADLVTLIARYNVLESMYQNWPTMTLEPSYKESLLELCVIVLLYFESVLMSLREETGLHAGKEALLSEWVKKINEADEKCRAFSVTIVEDLRASRRKRRVEELSSEDSSEDSDGTILGAETVNPASLVKKVKVNA